MFLNDIGSKNTNVPMNFDELVFDRSILEDELALSFVDYKYLIAPFVATDRHDPQKVWSKSGAMRSNKCRVSSRFKKSRYRELGF